RTLRTPQPETCGERSPARKRPFMVGHYLTLIGSVRQDPFRESILNGTDPAQNRTAFHLTHRLFVFVQRWFPAEQKGAVGFRIEGRLVERDPMYYFHLK
ncbi:MAG: hypothetical protein WBN03_22755, partial [Desulfobacterales bacterium]